MCWKRVFITSAFSWQNSASLCPASFCTQRPNLPVTPDISWHPTFAFQSPIMKRTYFFGVLVLEGLVGLHRNIQLQHLQYCWLGRRLGLLWYWMDCLGNEQRLFCHFWDYIQVLHFWLFCWLWWLLISSKGFLPTVVDIMFIWVKFTHSNTFSLLFSSTHKRRLYTWTSPDVNTKSDWFYSLQPKMEILYTVSKNKTGSWLWVRSRTPYFQIQI